ncbi:hypothetical protein CDQ71_06875 [Campylobacter hyointestinalis subsp. hyointestinalis]|nr:hypothetical protein CDQ71_06875 [Campylobacter hyointestinalis subsp. hyointestinalis]
MKFLNIFKNKQETKKSAVLTQNGTLIEQLINTGVSSISDSDIDMILTDLTVTQCDVSRKAVTEKKRYRLFQTTRTLRRNLKGYLIPTSLAKF